MSLFITCQTKQNGKVEHPIENSSVMKFVKTECKLFRLVLEEDLLPKLSLYDEKMEID